MTPRARRSTSQVVGDYRRLLDRRDIDAVLIATPDHWHAQQTIDAIAAGKDVYVEKPASNTIPRINAMLDAYKKGKQVVQIGTQQRSWDHFIEAKKHARQRRHRQGHAHLHRAARQLRARERGRAAGACGPRLGHVAGAGAEPAVQAEPAGVPRLVRLRRRAGRRLGRAPRRRRALVHERRPRRRRSGRRRSARSSPSPTRIPNRCPTRSRSPGSTTTFLMTFANGEVARAQDDIEGWGVFFIGNRGSLQVNRMGWAVRPNVPRTARKQGPPPPTRRLRRGPGRRPGRRGREPPADRAPRVHQPEGRRRGRLPARRAHAELPRLPSSRARSRPPTWRSATTPRFRACSRSRRSRKGSRSDGTRAPARAARCRRLKTKVSGLRSQVDRYD